MNKRRVKVAAIQQGPFDEWDIQAAIQKVVSLLQDAGEKGANIVTLCETSLSPYFPSKTKFDYDHYFLSINDDIIKPIFNVAHEYKMVIVLPFAEKDGPYYYNTAAVIDTDGQLIGRYRKVHIPGVLRPSLPGGIGSYEKYYFAPGNLGFPVFKTSYGKIGIQICYDRKLPEGSRILALRGAEIIVIPISAATYGKTSQDTWDIILRARAYENGVYVIAANKVGDENGRLHMGRSMIISPIGAEILAEGSNNNEEIILAEIDLDKVIEAQKDIPWWRDRRPSEYIDLCK